MSEIEYTDRYTATGRPYPCPWTMCKGDCDGMGLYPMRFEEWAEMDTAPPIIPQLEEDRDRYEEFPPPDGYLFVYCEDCNGTGKRIRGRIGYYLAMLYTYYEQLWWPIWAVKTGFLGRGYLGEIMEMPRRFLFMHRAQKQQRMLLRRVRQEER